MLHIFHRPPATPGGKVDDLRRIDQLRVGMHGQQQLAIVIIKNFANLASQDHHPLEVNHHTSRPVVVCLNVYIYIYCTVYIHVCWNYMILHGILWDCGISYSSVLYQYHIISYYTILSQCTTLYFITSYNSTIIYIVSCCGTLSVIMFIAYDISWCYFLSQKS